MQVWGPETLLFSIVATLFFERGLGLGAEHPGVPCPLLCNTNVFASCFSQAYVTFRVLTSCLYPRAAISGCWIFLKYCSSVLFEVL